MSTSKFYTVSEVAEILGVSSETIRRWDNTGKFTSKRHPINNYRVYTDEQIQSIVEDLQLTLEYGGKPASGVKVKNEKVFFETNNGKLYNQDAIDFLKNIETGTIDLMFGGSGTTYAVAEAYERKWLGNDISDTFCKMIRERLSDEGHLERIASAKDEKNAIDRRAKLRS